MKRAAIAFALCAAAFAATPASACYLAAPCAVEVYVPPYEPDLPPPQILALVKQRHDGGLSLAGFYNEPYEAPGFDVQFPPAPYEEPGFGPPPVIYSHWGHYRRHAYYRGARYPVLVRRY